MKVAVVGAGSWGTTVAALVAPKADTVLWARRPELATTINAEHENPDYLAGFQLPMALRATADLENAVDGADIVVMGVPSHGYRAVIRQAATHIGRTTPIVSLAKGIEQDTLARMTEVTHEELPDRPAGLTGVLTGPNLAREIMEGQPAASVIAIADMAAAKTLQDLFIGDNFRVYTNSDVVGCEAAGSLKNVMAIAAGMAHGLGFGNNTMATLITRALAELTRLGVALGGEPLTFAGLAGMGDLVATCMSEQSRNHRVGFALGEGKTIGEVTSEMNMVAEGVKTTPAVLELGRRYDVELPIATAVGRVLHEGLGPMAAVASLMGRSAKSEHEDFA